jgi:hypothetical protein
MLPAQPDAAQSIGGQTIPPEIADARQEQPRCPALRPNVAGTFVVRLAPRH